jgi:hypothetical protein
LLTALRTLQALDQLRFSRETTFYSNANAEQNYCDNCAANTSEDEAFKVAAKNEP